MLIRDDVRTLALANGFKLKTQPDGTEDLNPYVYEFAGALERYQRRDHIVEGYQLLRHTLATVQLPEMTASQRVAVEGFRESIFDILRGVEANLSKPPRG